MPSVVSLDRTFDDFRFLSEQFRQVIPYIVRRQQYRMVSARFVLEDTDRCPFAHASVEPIVSHESFHLFDNGHETLAYLAIDLRAILQVK